MSKEDYVIGLRLLHMNPEIKFFNFTFTGIAPMNFKTEIQCVILGLLSSWKNTLKKIWKNTENDSENGQN